MATYNGASFVAQQIESIQKQVFDGWTIVISDDSSHDETVEILKKISSEDPRVRILPSESKYGGAKNNFFHLINHSQGDYVLFCDQDDYWLSDKIEMCLEAIGQMEDKWGKSCPLLVSTDAIVADEQLGVIAPSFLDYEAFPHEHGTLPHTLVENNVCGCTIMCNRTLIELAKITDAYEDIIMHDWWLNLIATACGKTALVDIPTLKYRQHSSNSVGTHKFSPFALIRNFDIGESRRYWKRTVKQARKLLELYSGDMTPRNSDIISNYLKLFSSSRIHRIFTAISHGFTPTGLARRAGQIIVFAFSSKKFFQ